MRAALIAVCTVALTLPIAALSRLPYQPPDDGTAAVRYSLRVVDSGAETCRTRTRQELDALPAHMRTPRVCTREAAENALWIRIEDQVEETIHLEGGGLRGDRPVFVLREHRVPAGRRHLRVELRRTVAGGSETIATLDTVLAFEPGRLRLVTLDEGGRKLIAR